MCFQQKVENIRIIWLLKQQIKRRMSSESYNKMFSKLNLNDTKNDFRDKFNEKIREIYRDPHLRKMLDDDYLDLIEECNPELKKECELLETVSEGSGELDATIDPWKVENLKSLDYSKIVEKFGVQLIDYKMMEQMQKLAGDEPLHVLLRRGVFFAHQDLDKVIEHRLKGGEMFIYTGRGPSADSLHLGHMLPMQFTAYLQKLFKCKVVIEMSDEEKFYFKNGPLKDFMSYTENNMRDIIACGFDPENTFIFSSLKYESYMRPLVAAINNRTKLGTTMKIYGFRKSNTMGQVGWPTYQMAPALSGAFPHLFGDRRDVMCLVPCAIDQAPYFRDIRDHAEALGYFKPAVITCKFLISLAGPGEKLSTTGNVEPIFMNDKSEEIARKIKRYAFSGGGTTLEEHRKNGANLAVDVPFIYLYHFLEDDAELEKIRKEYGSGRMMTGEIKARLIKLLSEICENHRKARASINNELYEQFSTIKVDNKQKEYFEEYLRQYLNIKVAY